MSTSMIAFASLIAYGQSERVCTHSSGKIPSSGNRCFKVFTSPLIVIKKYACICLEAEQIKFIKVISTQMKQVNKRICCLANLIIINVSLVIKSY